MAQTKKKLNKKKTLKIKNTRIIPAHKGTVVGIDANGKPFKIEGVNIGAQVVIDLE